MIYACKTNAIVVAETKSCIPEAHLYDDLVTKITTKNNMKILRIFSPDWHVCAGAKYTGPVCGFLDTRVIMVSVRLTLPKYKSL